MQPMRPKKVNFCLKMMMNFVFQMMIFALKMINVRPRQDPEGEKTYRMNIWQGKFPTLNTAEDSFNVRFWGHVHSFTIFGPIVHLFCHVWADFPSYLTHFAAYGRILSTDDCTGALIYTQIKILQ